jgi:hypothetical protein
MRWGCSNKGDAQNPEIRSRLVCQEVKTNQSEDLRGHPSPRDPSHDL